MGMGMHQHASHEQVDEPQTLNRRSAEEGQRTTQEAAPPFERLFATPLKSERIPPI